MFIGFFCFRNPLKIHLKKTLSLNRIDAIVKPLVNQIVADAEKIKNNAMKIAIVIRKFALIKLIQMRRRLLLMKVKRVEADYY